MNLKLVPRVSILPKSIYIDTFWFKELVEKSIYQDSLLVELDKGNPLRFPDLPALFS